MLSEPNARISTRSEAFAQQLLRNLGQLVRIDPSLGMAEFISNSAILPSFRPGFVLTATPCTVHRHQ